MDDMEVDTDFDIYQEENLLLKAGAISVVVTKLSANAHIIKARWTVIGKPGCEIETVRIYKSNNAEASTYSTCQENKVIKRYQCIVGIEMIAPHRKSEMVRLRYAAGATKSKFINADVYKQKITLQSTFPVIGNERCEVFVQEILSWNKNCEDFVYDLNN